MITTLNLFTSISWIITGVISAILSTLFLSKNPKRRLNQLFSIGFILWSFTMLFNGVVFAVAYRSLKIANIFRDLSVVSGIAGGFILFIAAYGIYFGADSLKWWVYVACFVIAAIVSGFGAANDWVTTDSIGGYKTTDNLTGKICIQIINAVFVIIANIFLLLTYKSSRNPRAKRRVGFFVIGYSTILIGMLMFIIDGLLGMFFEITPYLFPLLALITWVMGPVLMLVGFYVKAEDETVTKKPITITESQLLKAKQDQKTIERPS